MGGNCDCRYGILYAPMVGGGFCGFWLIWHLLLILWNVLFPSGVGLLPGYCCVFLCLVSVDLLKTEFILKQEVAMFCEASVESQPVLLLTFVTSTWQP